MIVILIHYRRTLNNIFNNFIAYYGGKANYMEHTKNHYDEMTFSKSTEKSDVEKIIYAIEAMIQIKELDINTDYESIKIAFDNSSYYVPNGYYQNYFYKRSLEIINNAKNIVDERSFNENDFIWLNKNILKLIQQVFDEEYFKKQIAHLRRLTTSGGKEKLRTLLHKYNVEQLKEYYQLISYGFEKFYLFTNEDVWDEMHEYLSVQSCRRTENEYLVDELEDNFYFFNYIDKEQITEIFLIAIEYHTSIAENAAEVLYDFGYDEALRYINTTNHIA